LRKDYIISREIAEAKPLSNWVERKLIQESIPLSERKIIIKALALFVRKIHDRGVYSTDFHQGNILIQGGKRTPPLFHLIDLHSLRIKKKVTSQERIKNLAQLNNFRISVADRLRFLNAYLEGGLLRGMTYEELVKEIASASYAQWRHLWKKRKRKCLQSVKEVEIWKMGSWSGAVRKKYSSCTPQILGKMNSNIREPEDEIIKEAPRILVKAIVPDQGENSQQLIAKKYRNAPGFLQRLRALFRSSRAKRGWINAHNLIMRGIPTPEPVAFGEKRHWGIIQESFFLTEKKPGAQGSDVFLKELSQHPTDLEKKALTKDFLVRLARIVRWMHITGISHGDLKASNILVTIRKKRPFIFLIDLDGAKIRSKVGTKGIAKDLSRLRAAFSGILAQAEQDYFIQAYRKDNSFFQGHEKRIMDKVLKLTERKIKQKLNKSGIG